ncbi:MAG: glycosyltransferase family 9 protein [Phycisphaerae bacterium]|nr:glycosyltransferase family 9 protein [Phycisphaerae bacterium]
MHPRTVRRIDGWLGRPICALLSGWCRFKRALGLARPDGEPRKILFVKLIEMGSTVLAHRAFAAAARKVGRENVYLAVFQANRPIADIMALVPPENVISVRDASPLVLFVDMLRAFRRIRALGIDTAIDMEGFARASAIFSVLSGARRRVGLHRFTSEGPYRGRLMTHEVAYNFYLHTSVGFLSLVEALDRPPGESPMLKQPMPTPDDYPPPFAPEPSELQSVQQRLNDLAGREIRRPIVILNPNASDLLPLRRWPTERFIELGKRLLDQRQDLTIVITGAPGEQAAAEEIARAIHPDRAICMAGRTTLRELLVLYNLVDVLVTNDSGPAHFAALTDVHVICLFGPETPVLYAPLTPRSDSVTAGLACSPCVNVFNHRDSPCGDNKCMQAIAVDDVLPLVLRILDKRST